MIKIAHGTNVVIELENGLKCSIDTSAGQHNSKTQDVNGNKKPGVVVLDKYNNIVTDKFIKDDGSGVARLTTKKLISLLGQLQRDGHKIKQEPYKAKVLDKTKKKLVGSPKEAYIGTSAKKSPLTAEEMFVGKDVQLRAKGNINVSAKVRIRKLVRDLNKTVSTNPHLNWGSEPFKVMCELRGTTYAIVLTNSKAVEHYENNRSDIHLLLYRLGASNIRDVPLTVGEVHDLEEAGVKFNHTIPRHDVESYLEGEETTTISKGHLITRSNLTPEEEQRFKTIKSKIEDSSPTIKTPK